MFEIKLYDIECEQSLLGCLILNSETYFKINSIIKSEYFFESAHKDIFILLKNFYEKDKIQDLKSLSGEIKNILRKYHYTDDYLKCLLNMGAGIIDVESYCNIIKNFYLKRQLKDLEEKIELEIKKNTKAEDIYDKIKNNLENIGQQSKEEQYTFDNAMDICAKRILDIENTINNTQVPENIIKTNIMDFDRKLGGIFKKKLFVLAGRSSSGKALPLDTKILTNKGWIKNKDIKIGDKVIDPFGKEVIVNGVFPQGRRRCYKIFFEDRMIEADKNHLWEIFFEDEIEPKILSTKQIYKILKNKKNNKKLCIRLFCGKYGINSNKSILFKKYEARKNFLFNYLNKKKYKIKSYKKSLILQQLAFSLGMKCHIIFDKINKEYEIDIYKSLSKKLYINKIEKSNFKHTQCISVDSNEHLYVIQDYIVTHNTTLSLQIALNVAKQNKNVLFFSQEMCSEEQGDKILSNVAQINSSSLRKSDVTYEQVQKMKNNMEKINKLPLYFNEKLGISGDYVRNVIKNFEKKVGKVDLVIIDHLQIMKTEDNQNNRVLALDKLSMDCKNIAKEFDCGMILLSQLSRKTEERDDPRPQLSDLRESGGIEQNADVVVFIYREAYYTERKLNGLSETDPRFTSLSNQLKTQKNQADLIIQKDRGGNLGNIKLYFVPEFSYFSDIYTKYLEDAKK